MEALNSDWILQTAAYARAAAHDVTALAFLGVSLWLILLVRKTLVPLAHVFLCFAFSLLFSALSRLLLHWPSRTEGEVWSALAGWAGAGLACVTAVLLYPQLPRIVKAIRGLYLSEARRRMLEDYSNELRAVNREMEKRVQERTEELVASHQNFQDVVNTIDGIVWEAEVGKPGFSFVSSQAERITGYPAPLWLREERFWQKILHPEDLDRLTGDRYQYPDQKKDVQSEYRIITADKRVLWMRDHIKVIYHKGLPHKMRGIMVDVTAQKKLESKDERQETPTLEKWLRKKIG
jgi:PAS domain S-box-containing protein